MENNWHEQATSGQNYIEINEQELDEILKGNEIDSLEKEAKETDMLFRL